MTKRTMIALAAALGMVATGALAEDHAGQSAPQATENQHGNTGSKDDGKATSQNDGLASPVTGDSKDNLQTDPAAKQAGDPNNTYGGSNTGASGRGSANENTQNQQPGARQVQR